jgi:hypothetical protein
VLVHSKLEQRFLSCKSNGVVIDLERTLILTRLTQKLQPHSSGSSLSVVNGRLSPKILQSSLHTKPYGLKWLTYPLSSTLSIPTALPVDRVHCYTYKD